MHKKDKGKLGEALVIAQVLENGAEVFVDFGDNSKVDLIVRTSEGLYTVQVKCVGREREESCKLYLYKSGPGYSFRYKPTDCNYFALVDAKTKRIAWVENNEELCSKRVMAFRMIPGFTNSFDKYEEFPFKTDSVQSTAEIESFTDP